MLATALLRRRYKAYAYANTQSFSHPSRTVPHTRIFLCLLHDQKAVGRRSHGEKTYQQRFPHSTIPGRVAHVKKINKQKRPKSFQSQVRAHSFFLFIVDSSSQAAIDFLRISLKLLSLTSTVDFFMFKVPSRIHPFRTDIVLGQIATQTEPIHHSNRAGRALDSLIAAFRWCFSNGVRFGAEDGSAFY